MFEYNDKKKLIYIVIITVVLFIIISKFIDSCAHSTIDYMMSDVETETDNAKLSISIENELEEIMIGIAQKNVDWTNYPLSKNFLNKYNNKDGIFPQYNFENVQGYRMDEALRKEFYEKGLNYQKADNNLKDIILGGVFYYYVGNALNYRWINSTREIIVAYYINNNGELFDISLIEETQELDEDGDPVRDYDKEFTDKNIKLLNELIFFNHNRKMLTMFPDLPIVRKEPISKKFADKIWVDKDDQYKGFIDFFNGLEYTVGYVYWLNGETRKEAFDNNNLYCICRLYKKGEEPYIDSLEFFEPIKNYLYKLDLILDKENKLDNIRVQFIKEISNEEINEKYKTELVEK